MIQMHNLFIKKNHLLASVADPDCGLQIVIFVGPPPDFDFWKIRIVIFEISWSGSWFSIHNPDPQSKIRIRIRNNALMYFKSLFFLQKNFMKNYDKLFKILYPDCGSGLLFLWSAALLLAKNYNFLAKDYNLVKTD